MQHRTTLGLPILYVAMMSQLFEERHLFIESNQTKVAFVGLFVWAETGLGIKNSRGKRDNSLQPTGLVEDR